LEARLDDGARDRLAAGAAEASRRAEDRDAMAACLRHLRRHRQAAVIAIQAQGNLMAFSSGWMLGRRRSSLLTCIKGTSGRSSERWNPIGPAELAETLLLARNSTRSPRDEDQRPDHPRPPRRGAAAVAAPGAPAHTDRRDPRPVDGERAPLLPGARSRWTSVRPALRARLGVLGAHGRLRPLKAPAACRKCRGRCKIGLMHRHYLASLLAPRSAALVGASDRPGSLGALVMRNLAAGGLKALHPVNPKIG